MRTSVHPFSDVSLLRPEGELLDVLRKGVDSMGGIARYVKPGGHRVHQAEPDGGHARFHPAARRTSSLPRRWCGW